MTVFIDLAEGERCRLDTISNDNGSTKYYGKNEYMISDYELYPNFDIVLDYGYEVIIEYFGLNLVKETIWVGDDLDLWTHDIRTSLTGNKVEGSDTKYIYRDMLLSHHFPKFVPIRISSDPNSPSKEFHVLEAKWDHRIIAGMKGEDLHIVLSSIKPVSVTMFAGENDDKGVDADVTSFNGTYFTTEIIFDNSFFPKDSTNYPFYWKIKDSNMPKKKMF